MTVKEALAQVLAKAECPPDEARLKEDLGVDSLESVQLCLELEELLHIEIDVKKLDKIETIADLTKLVKAYVRMRGHLDDCRGTECSCGFREVFWEDPVRKMADELLLH